jgi:hypothetical protein
MKSRKTLNEFNTFYHEGHEDHEKFDVNLVKKSLRLSVFARDLNKFPFVLFRVLRG